METSSNSRTQNAINNSISGMIAFVFVMIATMATRIMFARYFGQELLGLNSLYTAILQILQVTELGIGHAMIIFLYEPITKNNQEKIKSIMRLYKKVNILFAVFLLLFGLLVQELFLPRIVDVSIELPMVKLYYFLFLLGVVCSYLYAYSKSILYAEQNNRFIAKVNAKQKVVISCAQLIAIFCYDSYIGYLVLQIIGYLVENLICHFYVSKKHPYINEKDYDSLSADERKKIIGLIKPLFVVQLADKLLSQTTSVLINQYVNIVTLGMYSNYYIIFTACTGLFMPLGAALTTSYGNLAVSATPKEKYRAYDKSYVVLHMIALLFCVYFVSFIQDFILIAFKDEYLLTDTFCILMTVYLYLTLIKTIYYSYQNAMGLHRLDQLQMIMSVFFNVVGSIIGAKVWGLNGIIAATILSLIVFPILFKGRALYIHAFDEQPLKYYARTCLDIIKSVVVLSVSYWVSSLTHITNPVEFFKKAMWFIPFGALITLLPYINDKNVKFFIDKAINKIRGKRA